MRIALTAAAALLLALPGFAGEVPRPAPPLEIQTRSAEKISLDALKGKVVLVMFFSTDCPHCQQTATILKSIYQEYKPQGLEILGLATNAGAVTNLDAFSQEYGAEFPLALTTRSEFTRFIEKSVMARLYVPYMIFIDREGMIQAEHPGQDRDFYANQEANIRAVVERLLAAGRQKASE